MAINWNEAYTSGRDYRTMNELLLDKILAETTPAGKIALDLGCGTGDLSVKLAKRGYSVTGVDVSDVAIIMAKQRATEANVLENTDFQVMDVEDDEQTKLFNDSKYDLITCKLVFAFMNDKAKVLMWAKNHLTLTGTFVLITPVLHDGLTYTPRMRNISVLADQLDTDLNAIFSTIKCLHKDYIDENGEERTIIAK